MKTLLRIIFMLIFTEWFTKVFHLSIDSSFSEHLVAVVSVAFSGIAFEYLSDVGIKVKDSFVWKAKKESFIQNLERDRDEIKNTLFALSAVKQKDKDLTYGFYTAKLNIYSRIIGKAEIEL